MDSTIWEGMQKQQLDEGLLLTSCGAELQELMRQIDIMVRRKKMDWEMQMASVQDEIELREQELVQTKSTLNQKHQEIGLLKHKLEGKEASKHNMIKQYEARLKHMKNELQQLKSSYSKMQKHHAKQGKANEREEFLANEVEELKTKLELKIEKETEFMKEKNEWEINNRALKHQIQCLATQRKSFADKSERIQQQVFSYQARLKRSNQMIEEVDSTSQTLIKKLECELMNDKELIQTQENLIKEMQNKTKELDELRRATVREKYELQEELDKSVCQSRVLEEENRELRSALNARESAMRDSEHEHAELRNRISDLENMLHTKQKLIESLQTRSPLKSKEDELQRNILHLEALVTTYRNTELSLKDENRRLQKELDDSKHRIKELTDAVRNTETNKVNNINVEIRRLRHNVEEMETSHSTKLCRMKAEVTNLASELQSRDVDISHLGQTCGEMERQLREECQRRDQLDAELKMMTCQLDSIRTQQGFVSQMSTEKKMTDQSLIEAENGLLNLKENYSKAVGKLENENRKLQVQVIGLKDQMLVKEHSKQENYASALNHTRNVISGIRSQSQEDMKIDEICREYEKKIDVLNCRLREMASRSEENNSKLAQNKRVTTSQPRASRSQPAHVPPISLPSSKQGSEVNEAAVKDYLEDLNSLRSRTPTPTRQFLESIGIQPATLSGTSAGTSLFSTDTSMDEKELDAILGISEPNNNGGKADDIQEFMKEEEARTKALESRINNHIENMKDAMETTVQKYFSS